MDFKATDAAKSQQHASGWRYAAAGDAAAAGSPGRVDDAAADALRIAMKRAQQRLEAAERDLAASRSDLERLPRTEPAYAAMLSDLHVLERSAFSRRLELSALCREWRLLQSTGQDDAGGAGPPRSS
jgi:hypothetical protein